MIEKNAVGQVSTRAGYRALAVGCAGFSLISFNTTATNLAFGAISDDFPEASQSTVSWVASVFFIGLASLLLVSGRLADLNGRRRVFQIGLVVFAVGSALSAAAPNVWMLIGARFVASVGGALVIPSSLAAVLPEFPRERHFAAIALWSATGPVASSVAPALAALVLAVSSWRVLFLLSAPIALGSLAASWRFLRESRSDERSGSLDVLGVLVGTITIASLVFAVSQGANLGWGSPAVVAGYVGVLVGLPLFVRRCRRHPQPLLNLDVFKLRPVWTANLANFFLNLAAMGSWLAWPLYFSRVWGYPPLATGLALMPGPIVSGIAATYGTALSERVGAERMVRWGSIVPVLGNVWPLVFLSASSNYWISAAPALALMGGGWGLTQPPLNTAVMAQVGADGYGEANASFNTVRNIAAAMGIAIAVAVIGDRLRPDPSAAYDRVFIAFGLSAVACLVVLALVYPRVSTARRPDNRA